ncbi:siderophore-interacting protein [Corynebacterium sp. 335C]
MAKAGYRAVTAEVLSVSRPTPAFARVRLGGPGMAELGLACPVLDQRFKLIVPDPGTGRWIRPGDGPDWYREWTAIDESERGAMRTYSIRRQELGEDTTEWDVDVVLHVDEDGTSGPAAAWAASVRPGDVVGVLGPERGTGPNPGQAFRPGAATEIVLAGDETAAPAIARILEDLPEVAPGARAAAFIETPTSADVPAIDAPDGAEVRWLPRDGAPYGTLMASALLEQAGLPLDDAATVGRDAADAAPLDRPTWDVPEEVNSGRYYWIAGESSVVVGLRRRLVADGGLPRSSVAFMGYWRKGAPMA